MSIINEDCGIFLHGNPAVGKTWTTLKQLSEIGKVAYINLDNKNISVSAFGKNENIRFTNATNYNEFVQKIDAIEKMNDVDFLVADGITNFQFSEICKLAAETAKVKDGSKRGGRKVNIEVDTHIMEMQQWGVIKNRLGDIFSRITLTARRKKLIYIIIGNSLISSEEKEGMGGSIKIDNIEAAFQGGIADVVPGFFQHIGYCMPKNSTMFPYPPKVRFIDTSDRILCRCSELLANALIDLGVNKFKQNEQAIIFPLYFDLLIKVIKGEMGSDEYYEKIQEREGIKT